MAGFPLYAIGSALSGFMQGYDQDQKRAQQQQLQQMQQREVMQKLQQQQQQDQATGLAFQALVAGGLDPNNQGKLPSGAPPMPGQASTPNAMLDYGIDSDSAPTKQLASLPGGATPYSDAPAPGSIGTGAKVGAPFPASQAADIYSGPDQALGGQTQPPPPPRQPDPVRYAMATSGAQPGNTPVSVPQMISGAPSPNAQLSNVIAPGSPGFNRTQTQANVPGSLPSPNQMVSGKPDFSAQDTPPPQWPGINAPAGQPNPAMAQAALNQMVPPPIQHAAKSIAVQAANQSPTQVYGGANIQQMAQAIDKANPGAPPAVKFLALSQYVKLMAPEEKQQFAMMMLQNRQDLQLAMKQMQIDAANARSSQNNANKGWDVQTIDDPNKPGNRITVRINKDTGQIAPLTMPGGAPVTGVQKVGPASQNAVSPQAVNLVAQGIANYQLPPLSGWAMKTPQGQATMAKVMELNPDYNATEFSGKQAAATAGARTGATRSKNLEMATDVAEEQIPLVKATSDRIDRTQFPTINALQLAIDKGTGGEDVVRFMEQINTLKYVYARALNPTGVARIQDLERFDNIINQAWSKGQINAALDQMQQSLAAERRGVNKATGAGPGKAGTAPAQARQWFNGGTVYTDDGTTYFNKDGTPYVPKQ